MRPTLTWQSKRGAWWKVSHHDTRPVVQLTLKPPGLAVKGDCLMKFTKMHGAGNDYIYIDARNMDEDWHSLSRAMSDRHFGVGGDGIILIMGSDIADLKMRMFNADGSEGEMCGNGIRCFAKYAIERGIASPPSEGLRVETLAGIR